MKLYQITYDLRKQRNYQSLYERIKAYGYWCRPLESTWVIATGQSAIQVRDNLKAVMDADDGLLVTRLQGTLHGMGWHPSKPNGCRISTRAAKSDQLLRQGWRFYPGLLMPTPLLKLSELAEVRSGYTFRGALEHDPSGDTRVLQIKDLRHSAAIEPDKLIAITWDARTAAPLLQAGDIAVISRGDSNKAALYNDEKPVVATSQFFIVSAKKPNVLPEYLCWMINLPQSQRSLERSGSSIKAISKGALQDMLIPLPLLATQQKLIELQRLWDEEDQLIVRLHTNREQMLQGIYQHLIKD